jgi:predicted nucleotidyltransferase
MARDGLKHLTENEKAALRELVERLQEQYGSSLVTVKLFGSKARGDFDADSDVDVLVVVQTADDWEAQGEISGIGSKIDLKYDVLLSQVAMTMKRYNQHRRYRSPLYKNILKEGVTLWTKARRSSLASVSAEAKKS